MKSIHNVPEDLKKAHPQKWKKAVRLMKKYNGDENAHHFNADYAFIVMTESWDCWGDFEMQRPAIVNSFVKLLQMEFGAICEGIEPRGNAGSREVMDITRIGFSDLRSISIWHADETIEYQRKRLGFPFTVVYRFLDSKDAGNYHCRGEKSLPKGFWVECKDVKGETISLFSGEMDIQKIVNTCKTVYGTMLPVRFIGEQEKSKVENQLRVAAKRILSEKR